jgi:HD-GYP domain-containing protein (c-di-GMP phosphodiesterase class II)
MKLSAKEVDEIKQACELHDLGKIGIHDYILTKSEKLTPQEWEEVRLHSLKAAEILEPLRFLKESVKLIQQHHERYDGKGYPYRLKGKSIHLGASIMAVADAFDAMISERPYREKPLTKQEAVKEIRRNSGTQFDPQVVNAFSKIVDKL